MEIDLQIQFISNIMLVAGNDETKAKFSCIVKSLVELKKIMEKRQIADGKKNI
jgi:hypothetical protein